jgi:hypothetical protein
MVEGVILLITILQTKLKALHSSFVTTPDPSNYPKVKYTVVNSYVSLSSFRNLDLFSKTS